MDIHELLKNPYVLGGLGLVFVLVLLSGKSGNAGTSALQAQALDQQTAVSISKINAANQQSANQYAAQTAIAQMQTGASVIINQSDNAAKSYQLTTETAAALQQSQIKAQTEQMGIQSALRLGTLQSNNGLTMATMQNVTQRLQANLNYQGLLNTNSANLAISSNNNSTNLAIADLNAQTQQSVSSNSMWGGIAQAAIGAVGALAGSYGGGSYY